MQSAYTYYAWSQQGERLKPIKGGADLNNPSLQSLECVYDPVGNITTIKDYKALTPLPLPPPQTSQVQSFAMML